MLVVQVEKPENATLASWFSELRSWFDENHCQPLGFIRSGRRIDRVIYQVSFHDAAKARRFSATFAKYAPTVRRATADERTELATIRSLHEAAE
jgi:transposase